MAALAGAACSAPSEVATLQASIVNGELSDETDDAVVEVYAGEPGSQDHCSGALIAPNVMLTALHCVAEFDTSGKFTCDSTGALTTRPPAGSIGATKDPATITVHVGVTPNQDPDAIGATVFGSRSNLICRNDIAVVVLDRELDLPVAPVRLERRTRRGELVRAVGYGSTGMSGRIQRYVRRDVTVTHVGEERDFEPEGTAAPNTFVVTEGPCQGDSGGPAISEETGAVVGVYSISAGSSCTAPGIRNVFTTVAPFVDMIQEAMELAGHEPVLEPPEPVVEGGAGGQPPEPQGGSLAGGTGGTAGTGGGRGGAHGGTEPEPEDPGSGSRDDASCACRVVPAKGAANGAGIFAALLAIGLLRRRR